MAAAGRGALRWAAPTTGRFDEAESAMADALSGLAEMQLSAISVYMCRPQAVV